MKELWENGNVIGIVVMIEFIDIFAINSGVFGSGCIGNNPRCAISHRTLQLLHRRIPAPIPMPPHLLLPGALVLLKRLYLRAIHVLHHLIRLPFLEAKA